MNAYFPIVNEHISKRNKKVNIIAFSVCIELADFINYIVLR